MIKFFKFYGGSSVDGIEQKCTLVNDNVSWI
jgi:hypothetical protein